MNDQLTCRIVFVYPEDPFFIPCDDSKFSVSKEKVCAGHANSVGILSDENKFIWIFLFTTMTLGKMRIKSCVPVTHLKSNQPHTLDCVTY